jgi:hypothetical protein
MKMTLRQWLDNGWLEPHRTSREEIGRLLAIVERDLRDAEGDISLDWRFGIAYNAALEAILTQSPPSRRERPTSELRPPPAP